MKIMDIHSHTNYSGCGRDPSRLVVETAVNGGIELFGISDHNYGIGERKQQYFEEISALKEEFKDKIKLLAGIEISVLPNLYDIKDGELEKFDYCLVELNASGNIAEDNFVQFAKDLKIPTGIAHTDLFAFCKNKGFDTEKFFTELAESGIFWEMNVNYDSIHKFREHQYVKDFFESPNQQELVKKTGLMISIGFDGHNIDDYLPERVIDACRRLEKTGVKTADTLFI